MIPFSPPHISEDSIKEVVDTLRSGWITTGPRTKSFEKKLEKYTAVPSVLCTSSATAGLELILRWFGVGHGDEVILPAYTYCATANVVVHCGATPVLVDSGENDFNLDVSKVKQAISPRTKVIIPVDIGGYPADYDALYQLINASHYKQMFQACNENQEKLGRILILADAAHSLGARYKGRMSGALADLSVFSFHAVKNLTTAEGGAICLNLPEGFCSGEVYDYLRIFSLHGQSKDALAKSAGNNWRYDVLEPGYKANMTDIQAAIGMVELDAYETDILPRRWEILKAYHEAFKEDERVIPPICEEGLTKSSAHLFMLRIKGAEETVRDKMIDHIFSQGVSVNVHFQPIPMFTAYKRLAYKMENYPVAYANYCKEISLPIYFQLSDKQVETVITAVKKSLDTYV